MNQSRFLSAPIVSFFDFKIFREAVGLSSGKSFLYLAYLSLVFTVALFLFGWINMPKMDAFVDWLKVNATGITITDKGMSLDASGRKVLDHPQLGPLAVFDDTREVIQSDEMGEYRLYVTSKMVYMRQNGTVQASPIGSRAQGNFETRINQETIQKLYDRLKLPVSVLILLTAFIFGFVMRLVAAFFLALLGVIIQWVMPRKLSFAQLFNLGSFSLFAALWFSVLQLVPALNAFSPGFLGFLLTVAYFMIGLTAQPKAQTKEEPQD